MCMQVDESCPKCGNIEMEFYTMQLRSADEGQTVFYECAKCKYEVPRVCKLCQAYKLCLNDTCLTSSIVLCRYKYSQNT